MIASLAFKVNHVDVNGAVAQAGMAETWIKNLVDKAVSGLMEANQGEKSPSAVASTGQAASATVIG